MAKKGPSAEQLTETARKIGSTLGEAVAKADRVVKGVKAAAKAGKEAYARSAKPARKRRPAKKKTSA